MGCVTVYSWGCVAVCLSMCFLHNSHSDLRQRLLTVLLRISMMAMDITLSRTEWILRDRETVWRPGAKMAICKPRRGEP